MVLDGAAFLLFCCLARRVLISTDLFTWRAANFMARLTWCATIPVTSLFVLLSLCCYNYRAAGCNPSLLKLLWS
jgi:hypothetical protein